MSVVERKNKRGASWYAVFWWQGRAVWERATDKRKAERLEKRRRAEVKAGTYTPPKASEALTFGEWARAWMDRRATRTASTERMWLETYVLSREWLAELPLLDLAPKHLVRLVTELQGTIAASTGELLAPKSVANIYGAVRTLVRDARIEELVPGDPCVLPRGLLLRGAKKRRTPYTAEEAARLIRDPRLGPDARAWNALAFLTGLREGEVCGLRWSDYDDQAQPLGCLAVERQYEGRPLKTSKSGQDRPRRVPVHPELAAVLADWREHGFELVHRRRPTPSDPIVPSRAGEHYQRAAAYKLWRRSCAAVEVENRSLHSTRHTFISLARRGGARKDVLERVTHNAAGDIVDAYTTWDWEPLCEAVSAVRLPTLAARDVDENFDARAQVPRIIVEAPGIEYGRQDAMSEKRRGNGVRPSKAGSQNQRFSRSPAVSLSARQRCGLPGDDLLRVPPKVQAFVAEQIREAMRHVHRPQREPVLGPLRLAAIAIDLGRLPPSSPSPAR